MHIAYGFIISTAGHDRHQNLQVRRNEPRLYNHCFDQLEAALSCLEVNIIFTQLWLWL